MTKRLDKGDKAPFSGTLLEDEGLREIDMEMTEKRICERKLEDATNACDAFSTPWPSNFVYFVMGAALGAIVVNSVSH